MAMVLSSNLTDANSAQSLKNVKDMGKTALSIKNAIDNFVDTSKTELKGGGFDAVRAKLSVYSSAFDIQNKLCNILSSNTKSANNNLLNYMEGFTRLDDSNLADARGRLSNAHAMLAWLQSTSKVWVTEDGERTQKNRRNGTNAQITAYNEIIQELKKLVDKLDKLQENDATSFSMLSDSGPDVDNYNSCVNELSASTFDL